MKILIAACAILIAASSGAHALPSELSVGLYADEERSVMSVYYGGVLTQFEVWVWWLPSERGLHSTMFYLTYPSNVSPGAITPNPIRKFLIGCNDGYAPMCVTFRDCQCDWVWTHRQTCYLMDAQPSVMEFATLLEAANCGTGYPVEPITILNKLALNQGAVIAVEPQTWGAIKSLYR
jgi:hypothetical protein